MIPVRLPDGRTVNINTDDPEQAKIGAAKYYNKTRQVQAVNRHTSQSRKEVPGGVVLMVPARLLMLMRRLLG